MLNLLTEPLFRCENADGMAHYSLPEVYAALMADRVDCFTALRAHQEPAWHMFLVQLGAVAMHRAGLAEPPADAETWRTILRALTSEFPADEPWHLVVEDQSKPAFMQPPVPTGLPLAGEAETPDALDMLITARNHDLKQAVAGAAEPDDWIFALVSLQTSEGFGGRNNYGIARMNGGSSSRIMMGLAPMACDAGGDELRPGPRVSRDLRQLVARRAELMQRFPLGYPASGGLALTWTAPWNDGEQLRLSQLDILFIEVCRRVRLRRYDGVMVCDAGNSSAERIAAKDFKGVLGDPWAPVDVTVPKALTIGDEGDFDYKRVVELLSAKWELPLLAKLGPGEASDTANWLLVLKAFARGNSKTGGFKQRVIPLDGRIARGLGARRQELHQLAKNQIHEIKQLDGALKYALAVAAAGGDRDKVGEAEYARSRPFRARLDEVADRLFFPALWDRFAAEQAGDAAGNDAVTASFIRTLADAARDLLEEGIAAIPCPSVRRPRAEARARRAFQSRLADPKHGFPHLFARATDNEETSDAA